MGAKTDQRLAAADEQDGKQEEQQGQVAPAGRTGQKQTSQAQRQPRVLENQFRVVGCQGGKLAAQRKPGNPGEGVLPVEQKGVRLNQ